MAGLGSDIGPTKQKIRIDSKKSQLKSRVKNRLKPYVQLKETELDKSKDKKEAFIHNF